MAGGDEAGRPNFEDMTTEELSQWYLEETSRYPEVPPGEEFLTPEGPLLPSLLPAAYIDTCVIEDYLMTEGADIPDSIVGLGGPREVIISYLREALFSDRDKSFDTLASVRNTYELAQTTLTLVTSPLTLMELQSNIAEKEANYWISETAGMGELKRPRGRKQPWEVLQALLNVRDCPEESTRQAVSWAQADAILNHSYLHAHGLWGIAIASIHNFDLSVTEFWQTAVWLMSYLQIGAADVLHVCIAKHLGCQYFVSFDGGLKRVRDQLQSEMGLELICSREHLVHLLQKYPNHEAPGRA